MRNQIIELIKNKLEIEDDTIDENTRIEDIKNWDSIAHILIIGDLEEKMGISIPLDQAIEITTIGDLFEKAGV